LIPRIDIEVSRQLPAVATYWTPKSEDLSEEGFGFFRGTWLIASVSLEQARATMQTEVALAKDVAVLADSPEAFDEVAGAIESGDAAALPQGLCQREALTRACSYLSDDALPLEGLELGVAGLVYALSSIGCWPAASCRGHPGPRPWSDSPVVFFAADQQRARALAPLVEVAGCGFDVDEARPNLLVVLGPSILETMALARQILDHCDTFTAFRTGRVKPLSVGEQLAFQWDDSHIT
jgi:hypothetical protein